MKNFIKVTLYRNEEMRYINKTEIKVIRPYGEKRTEIFLTESWSYVVHGTIDEIFALIEEA